VGIGLRQTRPGTQRDGAGQRRECELCSLCERHSEILCTRPARSGKHMDMRAGAWAAMAGLAATALTACGGTSSTPPTLTSRKASAAASTPAVQPQTVRWVDLDAGECLADIVTSECATGFQHYTGAAHR
jgi:hypothetical protein